MGIFITGVARFIRSIFVHAWLSKTDKLLVILNKLTYACNPKTLIPLKKINYTVFQMAV
jgi:dTDP-D-glucose 4,6-dehydratase